MHKILIIDDHANIRDLYREAFETAGGFTVIEAVDGQQGIDTFAEQGADLVITDIQMPERDGHEVIREIRKLGGDVKIIAITGAGLYNLPVAHELGADKIFEKPLRPQDLINAAKELIS